MKIEDLEYLSSSEESFWSDPVGNYAAAARRGKIFRTSEGVEVLDFRLHGSLLRNRSFHADHTLLLKKAEITHPEVVRYRTSFLVQTRGNERIRIRTAVGNYFTPAKVTGMRSDVRRIVDSVLADAGSGPIDFSAVVASRIPALVYLLLIGGPEEDEEFIRRMSETTMQIFLGRPPLSSQIEGAYLELFEYAARKISERRRRPGDDLVSHVAGRIDAGDLSEQEAVDFLVLATEASVDNSANIMSTATGAVLSDPDAWNLVASEPETYALRAREEALRMFPPSLRNRRIASDDMVWEGVELPQGTPVFAPNLQAGRDPQVYAQPDLFDLQRSDSRPHHAFGGGMFACLGQNVARLEVLELLTALAQTYPDVRLETPFAPEYDPPMFTSANRYLVTLA